MGVPRWNRSEVTSFEAMIHRRITLDQRYPSWTEMFPNANDQWDVDNGRIPLNTWEPWGTTLRSIALGVYDDLIRAHADAAKMFDRLFFIRFGHEMNGNWYPWSGAHNNDHPLTDGPSKYVAAWRHVHDIFAQEGANNAVWVWCPNRISVPNDPWNDYHNYYPGDAYVDWVCIDGYNRGPATSRGSGNSFSSLMSPIYATYATSKPIMIGETSSVERGVSKARWIADAESGIKSKFPSVAAFVWFNARKTYDWRAQSSESALDAFTRLANDPWFAAKPPLVLTRARAPEPNAPMLKRSAGSGFAEP
jgi:hypothetical protein